MFICETSMHRKILRIERDLMKILKDYRPYMKLRFISYMPINIGCLFRKSLERIPFRYTSNVVYKISCACGHSYIGQTCRRVPGRVREHKDELTKTSRFSYVAEQCVNSGHNIDWSNVEIITRYNPPGTDSLEIVIFLVN